MVEKKSDTKNSQSEALELLATHNPEPLFTKR